MLTVERTVYDVLNELAPDYCGGYWHFYALSNGGFYMAPEQYYYLRDFAMGHAEAPKILRALD
jgi:Antirestriction protein